MTVSVAIKGMIPPRMGLLPELNRTRFDGDQNGTKRNIVSATRRLGMPLKSLNLRSTYVDSMPVNDPASQIALGVLANGLYDFGRSVFDRVEVAGPISLDGEGGSATDVAIEMAVEKLTEVEGIREEIGGERLREFLRSPEMAQFGRQVFAFRLNTAYFTPDQENDDEVTDAESLERSFVRSLQLWTGLDDHAAAEHGGRLFSAFVSACDEGLTMLVNRNVLAAHDALSAMNTQRVIAELNNLTRNLELQSQRELDVPAILDFERRYRDQVADRDTLVSLPSLDKRVRFPVARVYVKPTLRPVGVNRSEIGYEQLLPLKDAAVVLGDPGGGKSTLISKLIDDICSGPDDETKTPILIVLRDYGAQKAATGCSLVEYMETRARSRYQIPEVPDGTFEYLLRNRRAVVLFDGLDELLETSARREIAGDVESFQRLFPTTPMLITSRKVGYEEAPLRRDRFSQLELGELSEDQVEEYTARMLELQAVVPHKNREALCDEFMAKSSTLTDLRANPLLLGLLLERYTKTLNLPAHRVAVIESCALLLFERWDSDRGIFVKFPFESKLKPVVSHLANEIYADLQLPQGATERWLVSATVNYLVGRKYEDQESAAAEAQEFIELCSGRTWVFSATGLNSKGEELFQFTHRTFMEYFVAAYLCRTRPEPDALLRFILPRVQAQEWDEVCQLAVHMLAREREYGADLVLAGLLPRTDELEAENLNQIVFCTRSLASLVPDRLETVEEFLSKWLSAVDVATMRPSESGQRIPLIKLLDSLVNAHPENQVTLARKLPKVFAEGQPARYAPIRLTWLIEVAVNLPSLLRPHADEAEYEVWACASEELAADQLPVLGAGSGEDLALDCSGVFHGLVSLDRFLEGWGFGGLLVDRMFEAMAGDPQSREVLPSLAESIIRAAAQQGTSAPREREREWALAMLEELAQKFLVSIPVYGDPKTKWDPPIVSGARRPRSFADWLDSALAGITERWTPGQLFAGACLLLALSEHCQGSAAATAALRGTKHEGLVELVTPLIAGRNFEDPDGPGMSGGRLLGTLDPEQAGHLRRWAAGEFSFTR
jgi:hypothetical protein